VGAGKKEKMGEGRRGGGGARGGKEVGGGMDEARERKEETKEEI